MLGAMDRARSLAYLRVLRTLRDMGPAKLWPKEQACIREAADALLFCTDIATDRAARLALADIATLSDGLIDTERWTPQRARRLFDDVWACGPGQLLDLPMVA
jgi:hypothetical protein